MRNKTVGASRPHRRQHVEFLIRERDAHIEKLIQAKRDVARLKALRAGRTALQERELSTAQKIVDNAPALIAILDERLAAAAG